MLSSESEHRPHPCSIALLKTRSGNARLLQLHLCCQLLLGLAGPHIAQSSEACHGPESPHITVDLGHPWRPPFGLDRIGAPIEARVELMGEQERPDEYVLVSYQYGRELARDTVKFTVAHAKRFASVKLNSPPQEVVLFVRCGIGTNMQEIARQAVTWPEVEAKAAARPEQQINPVDLGAVLVPHDWLLIEGRQTAVVDVAAISRTRDISNARLSVWYEGGRHAEATLSLSVNQKVRRTFRLPAPADQAHSVLHVSLIESERELWKQDIQTMIVARPPKPPVFGAVETKLRYDAQISVKNRATGEYSSIGYDKGWPERLNDVVVFLPGGSRFVFWRGASYVPFWAGLYNTGLSYQWAETVPPPGYVDCVEPLQDKELRYGRVQIIESSESRVHVRWSYESVDVDYRSLGDSATEDFYFYPDGFGTRVLTLAGAPTRDYEITEFITLLPQSAYPFEVLPRRLLEIVYLDGEKQTVEFPHQADATEKDLGIITQRNDPNPGPRIYRFFSEKRDSEAAIYFSPNDIPVVQQIFKPFYDRGELVTPGYWGNHWPLGRGAPTGGAIDERISLSPAHISTFGWGLWSGGNRPKPLVSGLTETVDAHGDSRQMLTQRWAWLIAKTNASDEELMKWAHSYTAPPSTKVEGARLGFPSYSSERRAIRLIAEASRIGIKLTPKLYTVNPVFEIEGAPGKLASVDFNSRRLERNAYAWDGKTLWVRAAIGHAGAELTLQFRALPET